MMKNVFKDIKVLNPVVFVDERGYFFESFSDKMNTALEQEYIQDNHSFSYKNVVRGLHYQWDNPMGKLVRAAQGTVVDYFVDIRHDSATYGEYDSIVLSAENKTTIWIPPGFAHGFETLSDEGAIVLYKCTANYNKEGESGINPLDRKIGIPWRTPRDKMILSEKDLNSQTLAAYSLHPKF